MAIAALVIGLLGSLIVLLPLLLRVPIEIAGPFAAPLGGGLCVVALVLLAPVLWSASRRGRARRAWRVGLALALLGLVGACTTEWALIRRERAERARAAEEQRSPVERAKQQQEDKQFEDDFNQNLNR